MNQQLIFHSRTSAGARPHASCASLFGLIALAFVSQFAHAGVIEAWVHRQGTVATNSGDEAWKAVFDAAGDVIVTGSSSGDFATVVYREHLPAVSVERVPNGVRISFQVVGGQHYELQCAKSVDGPWSMLASFAPTVTGVMEYVDSPFAVGVGFYRLAAVP